MGIRKVNKIKKWSFKNGDGLRYVIKCLYKLVYEQKVSAQNLLRKNHCSNYNSLKNKHTRSALKTARDSTAALPVSFLRLTSEMLTVSRT